MTQDLDVKDPPEPRSEVRGPAVSLAVRRRCVRPWGSFLQIPSQPECRVPCSEAWPAMATGVLCLAAGGQVPGQPQWPQICFLPDCTCPLRLSVYE